ncbi:MAG: phenylalanine--tRNA ligase subunit beta [Lactobacillus delbrueckii]|nr:phenylalanine--tRNA ligase subunit beta [Lactobacillus delbrueckii]
MLVSYNWLKDFLNMDGVDPYALAEKLTRSGVEIASTVHPEEGLSKLVVGHILTCEKIEGTHLNKTMVDVGEDEARQIVCGAPNVAAGQDVIVALPGAHLPGGIKIKKGKLRGIESNGMICGLQELGFSDSVVPPKYADGIWVFHDPDLKPGDSVFEALGMDDYVLDFDITPNRADTSSMEGAAYEVGALIDQKPKIEDIVLKEDGADWTGDFTAAADEKIAPKYYLRKLTGVKIAESPLWLQARLWNAGIRPINNVVDATNYVMLLTGQPMHAYDAKLFDKTKKIEVRLAKEGEKLQLLNEKEIDLDPQDIVITDGEQAVGLAGVMGGLNSEVTEETTDVILEAAVFDPALTRKAALRHDNRTDASALFEKGINWDNTQKALDACALILRENAGATVLAGEIKASDKDKEPVVITTTASRTNKILGTDLSMDEIVKILGKLNFPVAVNGDEYTVTVPNRRWDIFIDSDIFEEVGRIYGYDNIKSTHPATGELTGGYAADEVKVRHLRQLLEGQGLSETINYSLTSEELATTFVKKALAPVKVNWPLNSARTTMRQNLICGLLDTVAYNFARKQTELQLFENGRVYDMEGGDYHEHEHLAAAYVGLAGESNWQHKDEVVDFYYVKGQLEDVFEMIGVKDVEYRAEAIKGMHPTRTAGIYVNDEYIGLIGQIAPVLTMTDKNFAGKEIYVYELNLDALLPLMAKGVKSKPAPKYPAVQRDLSILVDEDVTNAQVESCIKENAGKYLISVEVIDVYQGAHLAAGKKSLAYRLTFLNEAETLTDAVVTKATDDVQAALEEKLEANIR